MSNDIETKNFDTLQHKILDENFFNLKSHQLDHTGLGNCLRELIGKYKHNIKSVDINRKILIDMSSENKFILEVKLLNSIIS